MRPLTNTSPKPLLEVAGLSLLEHQLKRLEVAGIQEVVINVSYLGEKIMEAFQGRTDLGLKIHYSIEKTPLETAGGIIKTLSFFDGEPFLLVNGDVWSDFPLESLVQRGLRAGEDACLLLVDNPEHHSDGDFILGSNERIECIDSGLPQGAGIRTSDAAEDSNSLVEENTLSDAYILGDAHTLDYAYRAVKTNTFAGISVLNPSLFDQYALSAEPLPLKTVLLPAITQGRVAGQYYAGYWCDVGTVERLNSLRARLSE